MCLWTCLGIDVLDWDLDCMWSLLICCNALATHTLLQMEVYGSHDWCWSLEGTDPCRSGEKEKLCRLMKMFRTIRVENWWSWSSSSICVMVCVGGGCFYFCSQLRSVSHTHVIHLCCGECLCMIPHQWKRNQDLHQWSDMHQIITCKKNKQNTNSSLWS